MDLKGMVTFEMRRSLCSLSILILATLVLALANSIPSVVNAQPSTQPEPLHTFLGSVSIDGNPAPQGTVVVAVINGVPVASANVDADGKYEIVLAEGANEGDTAAFTVDGLLAGETATIVGGAVDELNLTAISTAQPEFTPVPTHTATPVPPISSVQEAFRVGPTVRLRPVNDMIDRDMDGIVEILFRNPALNDTNMVVDLTVSIPSGFHLYGEGFATDTAAGAASGSFRVPPGQSRTIFLNIKAEKTGRSIVHFSGVYWPQGNKDLFNPVSLTHPFVVNEPSPEPFNAAPTNPDQVPAAPTGNTAPPQAATAVPLPPPQGAPSASCSFSPEGGVSNGAGDMMALLSLPLLGAGLAVVRRRRRS